MAIRKDGSLIGRPTKKQAAESAMRAKVEAQAAKEARDAAFERLKVETDITKQVKDRAASAAVGLNIEKQIKNIQDSILGKLMDKQSLETNINLIKEAQASGDKDQIAGAEKYATTLAAVASGAMDASDVLEQIAKDGEDGAASFGEFLPVVEALAKTMQDMPDLSKKLKLEADAQAKIDAFKKKLSEASDILKSPKAMGVAAIGMAFKLMSDFAQKALEVRQSLGTSAAESARLAGNMTAAGLAAKAVGGSSQEAENAVKGLVDEFGSLSVVSAGVSVKLGLMTGQFGISGANAAKLLKSMEAINGASIETNMNLISATGELARAEGVAPAKVLNDIAENTKLFAEFAKDGGENIAKAALHAAKLGLNLSNVAQIADKLLNFEQSIQDEMQAEMLIGKQLNLDKARQLALEGDLEGLMGEVTDNLVSQAEWSEMNVIQRRALADAIGVSAADMGKMVAGEKTSAQLAEDRVAQENKMLDVQKAIASVQIATAIAQLFAGNAKLGPTGIAIALGGIGALYAAISAAPKLETGGVVKETGMAQVHRGEVFSGTKNEMGFGNETNKLLSDTKEQNNQVISELKQARVQHAALMGTLKSAIDRIPMA